MTKVGCHISIRGGIDKAPEIARKLGCEAMQIFTRPPQGGKAPELAEKTIKQFKIQVSKLKIQEVYIHAPYFINLASKNNRIYYGSIGAIKLELKRASAIGAKYVITHLGSAGESEKKEALEKTIKALKKILDGYKGTAKLLIENSAGTGKIIGADFQEIEKILSKTKSVPNGSALAGICLDTQHGFASGYDLNKITGLKNIKLIHANDSMTEAGSLKDRHAHIGKGKIGLETFKKIAEFAKKNDIDLICETDYPGVIEDIKILKKFISSQ